MPKCFVRREWLRLALKTLASKIEPLTDDVPIIFDFRHEVISIRCDEERIVASAKGEDWPNPVCVQSVELRELPMRFMTDEVCVVVGDSHLNRGPMRCRILGKIE